MNALTVTLITVAIIVLSAFFVAVEFSLVAAKQNRLEEAAARSAAGRAALRNSTELTLLLAGSQLGITLCTLALGAITKPAVHHALLALLGRTGVPPVAAEVLSFVVALLIVTFLHLVVGEMSPKSWAIAHPERSAVLLALPMRAFMFLVRPVLKAMNAAANALVRLAGAQPLDELSSGQDAESLLALVEHSANVGALDALYRGSITSALELREQSARDAVPAGQQLTFVPADATVADVQDATQRTGHLRVLLRDGGRTVGVVHARDTLAEPLDRPARDLARPVLSVGADEPLARVVRRMRGGHRLVVVTDGARELGVVTGDDILPRLMPAGADGESLPGPTSGN